MAKDAVAALVARGGFAPVRRLVINAGMPRSGSSWLYNAMRLLLEASTLPGEFSHYWIADLTPDTKLTPVTLIKVHSYHPLLAGRAAAIVYSYRDVRDALASRARFTGTAQVVGEASYYVRHDRRWRERANCVVRYEDLRADADGVVRAVAKALGAETVDFAAIKASLAGVSEEYRRSKHITHGGSGTWQASLSPEVVAAIERRHRDWLVENRYPVSDPPPGPWDRLRRGFWRLVR